MELLADRDPEEARKILDPVLERMMDAVHRYEGTVNQVMGDGIMALFGAPLAHEDHAVRACYAALRMQESVARYAEEVFRAQGVRIHYYRGDYERVVELVTDNLAALPADSVYESFGVAIPVSVYDRSWLVMSLAQIGRFAEAASYAAEALRLAGPTQHADTIDWAHRGEGRLHLLKGDWAKARALIERTIAGFRTDLNLPSAVAACAWVLAQVGETSEALTRLHEGKQLLEHQAARGVVGWQGEAYHSLGSAGLLLGRLDEACNLAARAIDTSPAHPGFAAHSLHLLGDIAIHPDRLDAEAGEAHYRQALELAEPRGMRPLIAHCHLGLGKLYRRTGEHGQAREHLTNATTMYREMGMTYWLEQAGPELREPS
jgi:tetratricopeptide (TPR) repeat protein